MPDDPRTYEVPFRADDDGPATVHLDHAGDVQLTWSCGDEYTIDPRAAVRQLEQCEKLWGFNRDAVVPVNVDVDVYESFHHHYWLRFERVKGRGWLLLLDLGNRSVLDTSREVGALDAAQLRRALRAVMLDRRRHRASVARARKAAGTPA